MPYASAYTNQNAFDPSLLMGGDGVNKPRRTFQPPRPTVADLLAQQQAQQAAEQSANFHEQQQGTPQQVQPLPSVDAPVNAEMVGPTPPPGRGQQRYGTGMLGGPNVDEQGIAHIGVASPAGRSPLGRKLDEYRARSEASPDSKVTETGWGYEEAPPSLHGPSRLKKALEGFLTMGAMAGANGPAEGAAGRFLGGGIAGGAVGAAKPRLVQKFQRDTELGQLRDDIGADQSIEMKNAQIADEASKPELNSLRIQNTLNEALLRERDRQADNTRADRLATATEGSATERARHNKVMENKQPAGAQTVDYTVNGKTFKVSPNTAARLEQDKLTAGTKPNPAREAETEAELEGEAAVDHLSKRHTAEQEATRLRGERAKLVNAVKSNDIYPNSNLVGDKWELEKRKQMDVLDRQISDAEGEAKYRQKEADDAYTRQRKAKAKAGSAGSTAASATHSVRKTFNLGAWKADHPNATPAEVDAKRTQYNGYTIKE